MNSNPTLQNLLLHFLLSFFTLLNHINLHYLIEIFFLAFLLSEMTTLGEIHFEH